MSCCAKGHPIAVMNERHRMRVRYLGGRPLKVKGQVTGEVYRFSGLERTKLVDPRDAVSIARSKAFRVEGDSATLGKTAGKDSEANKPTYVKLLGLEGAKAVARRLLQTALVALDGFGESADNLRDLARYIVERDR